MKRLLILSTILLSIIGCTHNAPKNYYEIEGRVTGVEEGTVFTLFRIDGEAGMGIDRDTLREGRFYFRVTPEAAKEHMTILCWRDDFPSMELHLWAEAGDKVRIHGTDKLIYTWSVKGGADLNRSWQGYVRCAEDLYREVQQLMIMENTLGQKAGEAGADPADLQAQYESLGRQQQQLIGKIHGRLIDYMQRHKMDEVGMIHLEEMARMCRYLPDYPHHEAVKEIYNSLSNEWQKHPASEQIRSYLYPVKEVVVGERFFDGTLYDLAGNTHTISELEGSYILIELWSGGCGPCIMALPEMNEIAEKYSGQLQVVSISTDGEKMWRESSQKYPITWHNWSDGKEMSGICAHYDQMGTPSYTLISPEGIVIDRWKGYGNGSLRVKISEHIK